MLHVIMDGRLLRKQTVCADREHVVILVVSSLMLLVLKEGGKDAPMPNDNII